MTQPCADLNPEGSEISNPHADVISNLRSGFPSELANVAHGLNQPLTAILGNAQAARRFMMASEISRDELLAILDDIIHDTKRAGAMIRDLQAQHSPQGQQQAP